MVTTQKRPEMNIDVKPSLLYSAVVYAPFDEAKKALERKDYDIISLPVNAELRIQQGKESYISKNGNWVREGVLYIPGKGNKLVRDSPVLRNAKKATQAHRDGKEFYLTDKVVEKALEDSVDFPLAKTEIPVNRFNENDLTVWAFGEGDSKRAQVYGDFLKDSGISSMPVWAVDKDYVNQKNSPFVRQLWFSGLGGGSDLVGDTGVLHNGYRVRGVRSIEDAEGVAPKN